MTKRQDHKILSVYLRKAGVTDKQKRAWAHQALTASAAGIDPDQWQLIEGRSIAARAGFFVWDYFPLEKRRVWQEQPD